MLGFEPGRCLECLQGVRQFVGVVTRVAEVIERGGVRRVELRCSPEWIDCVAPRAVRQSWIPCAVRDSASAVRWTWAAAPPSAPPAAGEVLGPDFR